MTFCGEEKMEIGQHASDLWTEYMKYGHWVVAVLASYV
jgi:hypothetical protein